MYKADVVKSNGQQRAGGAVNQAAPGMTNMAQAMVEPTPRPGATTMPNAIGPGQSPGSVAPQTPTSGGPMMATSTGGVSAVNPQATGNAFANVDGYIDQSFNNAMNRLQPGLDAQRDALSQSLVDRGIGVGSEAYTKAMNQLDQSQNDAQQNAAFQAMQFGTGLQNQMFGQDAQRSQLANSLLQSQMSNRLGYDNMREQGRQFDAGLNERGRQFNANFGEGQRQYNDGANFRDLSFADQSAFRNWNANNNLDMQQFNMAMQLMNPIYGTQAIPIDVNGANNSAVNGQNSAMNNFLNQLQAGAGFLFGGG